MKKFIIIGNQNAIVCKEIFPYIKNNELWLGNQNVKEFSSPNGEVKKFGNVCWYTNVLNKKRNTPIDLYRKYNEKDYPHYDNYDAIEVSRVENIPIDYDGIMCVPITFLDKYCPKQFEILDLRNRYMIFDHFGVNETVRKNHSHCGNINGKATYPRIVIRKRK